MPIKPQQAGAQNPHHTSTRHEGNVSLRRHIAAVCDFSTTLLLYLCCIFAISDSSVVCCIFAMQIRLVAANAIENACVCPDSAVP